MKYLKEMNSYERVTKIGAALGGVGAGGFVTGACVAAGTTITAPVLVPIGIIVGTGAAIGAGISALGKFIFY